MSWVLIAAAWLVLAFVVAVVIGRSIRLADLRSTEALADEPNFVVDPAPDAVENAAPDTSVTAREPAGSAQVLVGEPALPPVGRDAPTVPGIPVARPSAAHARGSTPVRVAESESA